VLGQDRRQGALIDGLPLRRESIAERPAGQVRHAGADRQEKLVLVTEAVVERGLGDRGVAGDRLHRHAAESGLFEQFLGGADDPPVYRTVVRFFPSRVRHH